MPTGAVCSLSRVTLSPKLSRGCFYSQLLLFLLLLFCVPNAACMHACMHADAVNLRVGPAAPARINAYIYIYNTLHSSLADFCVVVVFFGQGGGLLTGWLRLLAVFLVCLSDPPAAALCSGPSNPAAFVPKCCQRQRRFTPSFVRLNACLVVRTTSPTYTAKPSTLHMCHNLRCLYMARLRQQTERPSRVSGAGKGESCYAATSATSCTTQDAWSSPRDLQASSPAPTARR